MLGFQLITKDVRWIRRNRIRPSYRPTTTMRRAEEPGGDPHNQPNTPTRSDEE